MRVVLLSKHGITLSRDVYAEIGRRMAERGCDTECVGRFTAAADEFQSEIEAYARSIPEEP